MHVRRTSVRRLPDGRPTDVRRTDVRRTWIQVLSRARVTGPRKRITSAPIFSNRENPPFVFAFGDTVWGGGAVIIISKNLPLVVCVRDSGDSFQNLLVGGRGELLTPARLAFHAEVTALDLATEFLMNLASKINLKSFPQCVKRTRFAHPF